MPTFKHKNFNAPDFKEEHNRLRKYRKNHQHLYNSQRWKRLRIKILNRTPYCQQCWRDKNQYVPANVVDHMIGHHGNERLMWDEANLQSMCKPCHDTKNGLTMNAKQRAKKERPKGEVL